MVLSNAQAVEVIKKPRNKTKIQRAIFHEDHLRFHAVVKEYSEIPVKQLTCPEFPYYEKYLTWVKSILTASDKFDIFKGLLTFPLISNEIIDIISDEYGKVFDAQDSYFNTEFENPELKDDFHKYLEDIGNEKFWKETIFNAMLSNISSVIICDLPLQQNSDYPEPYFYLVDTRQIIDIEVRKSKDGKDNVEYIAFNDGDRIIYIDALYYRVYTKVNDNYFMLSESTHDLGYTPCNFFWSDSMDRNNPILKQSPISSLLSRLNWYLFFETSKGALDLYAAYPIYWSMASTCNYKGPNGEVCDRGKIVVIDEVNKTNTIIDCPVCSKSNLVGPGSILEKPIPRGDLKIEGSPVGIETIDESSLNYNVDEVERLRINIIASATGKNKFISNKAINKEQVESQYESQTNVINWIARNFEASNKWLWDTLGKLRYGDLYKGSSINYGTQFYLMSLEDATKDYNDAIGANMPSYILMNKLNIIEHLQSKNNPKERNRINILKLIEPYPLYSLQTCKDMGLDTSDKRGFVLKANFSNFVWRFENENGSIINYSSTLSMEARIKKITEILEGYVDEKIGEESKTEPVQKTDSQTNLDLNNTNNN